MWVSLISSRLNKLFMKRGCLNSGYRIFIIVAIASLWGSGNVFCCAANTDREMGDRVSSVSEAREYCDNTNIDRVEGIWEFSEDETSVLIKRDKSRRGEYDLILLQSADCRFFPGDTVGTMRESVDRDKFRLRLRIEADKDPMTCSKECAATFSAKDGVIKIDPMKLKLGMRTMWFLPKFWRSVKVGVDIPSSRLPVGIRRVYPENTPRLPIYF